jgi:hypothetical protein
VGKKLVNIGFARVLGVTAALFNVNTIEGCENAFIAEVDTVVLTDSGNNIADGFLVGTADGEIVNLTANQHSLTLVHTVVTRDERSRD